jgi:hypothetical protein
VHGEVTQAYIERLVSAYPSIREVWLFGSRANNREREGSDWDYLVFGDDDRLLNSLHLDTQFNEPGIDLFFLAAPGIAMKPWIDATHKNLRLDDAPGNLNWRVMSATVAQYSEPINRELDNSPGLMTKFRTAKAVLVYRRDR